METEHKIWKRIFEKIGNSYGTAGLMGNLYAESGLNPKNLQNTFEKKLGMTDDSYTSAVDDGSYINFVHDGAGYGLAQWTYWSRKEKLLKRVKSAGESIGNLDAQLSFLLEELNAYSTVMNVLKHATSVKEASDIVLTKYEKPSNQSDSVKMKRAGYGQKFFDKYAEKNTVDMEDTIMGYDPQKVIDIAFAEVGYLEKKSNANLDEKTTNAGSNNYTKYARDLDQLGFYNGKKNGVAWCDIFVDWCFIKAYGYEAGCYLTCQTPGKSNSGAGCKYSRNYYKSKKQLFDTPQKGDQIFFYPKDGIGGSAIAHTGLVYDVDSTYVYTVEGNTSGASGVVANGGGVCKKKYKLTYNRIAGYGRPRWGSGELPATTKDDAPATQDTLAGHPTVSVTAASANVRTGDSVKYESVGYAKKGEVYELVATSNATGWNAIRFNGEIRWISSKYTKVILPQNGGEPA